MAIDPKLDSKTSPFDRGEQLKQALAAREANRTLKPKDNGSPAEGSPTTSLDTFEASVAAAVAAGLAERDGPGSGNETIVGQELGLEEAALAGELKPFEEDEEEEEDRDPEQDLAIVRGQKDDEEEDSSPLAGKSARDQVAGLLDSFLPEDNGTLNQQSPYKDGSNLKAERPDLGTLITGGGYTEEQDSLDDGEMAALLGGDWRALVDGRRAATNEEIEIMTGILADWGDTTSSKYSVAANSGSNPLGEALAYANTPEGKAEAAKNAGVTPSSDAGGTPTGGAAPAAPPEPGGFMGVLNAISQKVYGRPFMGDPPKDPVGLSNRNEMGALKGDTDSGTGTLAPGDKTSQKEQANRIEGATPQPGATLGSMFDGYAKQVKDAYAARDAKAAEDAKKAEEARKAEEAKKAEEARKKAEEDKKREEEEAKKKADTSTTPDPDGEQSGPPSEAEIRLRQHLYDATGYKGAGAGQQGGEVDPADEATPKGSGNFTIPVHKTKEGLIGQPGEETSQSGGTLGGGNLPGDQGNIDFGEENDTGQFTSGQRGGDPGDALNSIGGDPLEERAEESGEEEQESARIVKAAVFSSPAAQLAASTRIAAEPDDDQ